MTRGKATVVGLLALAALLAVLLLPGLAAAHYPPQCRFLGPVTIDGLDAPTGLVVTASLDVPGVGPWTTTTFLDTSGHTYYVLSVPADDPNTPVREGGQPGDIVHFRVNDGPVTYDGPDGVWKNGGVYHPLPLERGCVLLGDCNYDGVVNMADISCIETVILELWPPNDCADANQDGVVNVLDVTTTERIIVFGP